MPKDLKVTAFDAMLTASISVGNELEVNTEEINVQIEDSDGELYYIEDVVFNPRTKAIHLKFNYED